MAQNITIQGASYPDVPSVTLPKTGGGTAWFTDVTPTTAVESDVASGKVFFKADGTLATGTATLTPPTNMISNGDFSVAGATTEGWKAIYSSNSSLSVENGNLVLRCTSRNNVTYGISYSVNTVSGHAYLVEYKFTKTLGDSDADGKVVRILLRGSSNTEFTRKIDVAKNTVIEDISAVIATEDGTMLRFIYGGAIATSALAVGDSIFELSYVRMYDITNLLQSF